MTSPGLESDNTTSSRFHRRWWWLILPLILVLNPLILRLPIFVSLQRKLIYRPLRETPDIQRATTALGARIIPVTVETSDWLELKGWLVPAVETGEQDLAAAVADSRPLCIWFNGNAGHRAHRLPQIAHIRRLGAHVLIVDYRGYAENPGSPSEHGLADDAKAVWRFAIGTLKVPPRRIVICGESLGGGVATRLAALQCELSQHGPSSLAVPAGLFLQATFPSLAETGSYHYPFLPVKRVLRDRFDSVSQIPKITCPIAMVHGRNDEIVPFEQGRKLFDAAPARSASGVGKVFIELRTAGHNDIMSPEVGAIGPWCAALESLLLPIAPVEPDAN